MNTTPTSIALLFAVAASALAQPTITRQPTDFSVSLDANVTNQVTATGAVPLTYLWQFNETLLLNATNHSLILTNIQLTNAGNYSVVVSDSSGSVTSRVATLTVDPTFTKITSGAIVTDRSINWGACGWGDYDNDGFIDLVVGTTGKSFLYRNNGNGTFTKVTDSPIVTDVSDAVGTLWGDYDNDGNLDLFSPDFSGSGRGPRLYRNNGNGTFAKVTTGVLANSGINNTQSVAWGDYDKDGFLDLVVTKFAQVPELFRNNGDGTFTKMTRSQVGAMNPTESLSSTWVDYDSDGNLDVVFAQENGGQIQVYRNGGDGSFTLKDSRQLGITHNSTDVSGAIWGDFANRGFFDLFIVNGHVRGRGNDYFFRNNGDGTFASLTTNQVGSIVADASPGDGGGAADYDNDGHLDLFVANPGLGASVPEPNRLYHNNGDGTFTRVSLGSLTSDKANSNTCAWGDYDNDGFMDLYVANGWASFASTRTGFLYRNNGNSNRWLKLKLVGTVSNRAAIGAQVRVKATLAGKTFWQLRQVASVSSFHSQDDMRPHFGLGDATVAEIVRIEWPSGIVQELHNVNAKQILTVTEPAKLEPQVIQANGLVELKVKSWKGFAYDIEASNDLKSWTRLTTLTNETGTLSFADPSAGGVAQRFYRIQAKP